MENTATKKRNIGVIIAQVLLGLVFLVFGLNGFLHFIPTPPPQGPAGEFGMALYKSGYFFPFLKGTEVICGLLLLVNKFSTLALLILAPIVINILLFHAFLGPDGLPMSIIIVGLLAYLAWTKRETYKHVLTAGV
jgi:putative oxidoreductase